MKITQLEEVRFIKKNELKLTQVDLHSFFTFKSVLLTCYVAQSDDFKMQKQNLYPYTILHLNYSVCP